MTTSHFHPIRVSQHFVCSVHMAGRKWNPDVSSVLLVRRIDHSECNFVEIETETKPVKVLEVMQVLHVMFGGYRGCECRAYERL